MDLTDPVRRDTEGYSPTNWSEVIGQGELESETDQVASGSAEMYRVADAVAQVNAQDAGIEVQSLEEAQEPTQSPANSP